MKTNLTKTDQKVNVNKILVVGHPLSGYESVATLLDSSGMKRAKPSKREGMLPEQISATLIKAHQNSSAEGIEQIEVSPVWNGLALDLMLGNIDQNSWCWGDSEAIALLDYWKSMDSQLAFALVYNNPAEAIVRAIKENKSLSPSEMEQMLREWSTYNKALLNFYYRNPKISTLVHAKEIEQSTKTYLEHLEKNIGIPLKTSEIHTELIKIDSNSHEEGNDLYRYFAHNIVQEYPEALEIYQELQSVANLYHDDQSEPVSSVKEALYGILEMENNYKEKLSSLETKQKAKQKELEEQKIQLENLLAQTIQTQKASEEQTQENELLLAQLHTVQEELESHYLNNKAKSETLTKELENLKKEKEILSTTTQIKEKEFEEQKTQLNNLKKEKEILNATAQAKQKELETQKSQATEHAAKLQKELETSNAQKSKEIEEENELLLTQLHMVQEELERYYLENQKLKEKKQPPRLYGASERVKQQLSYKLGAKMIENSRSLTGILSVPFSLLAVVSQYRKDLKALGDTKLPPIHTYADAYEADKIKNHLSYMLGESMIETLKKPLGTLRLPWALMKTAQAFKQQKGNR